jgi:NSS family neurotransmitter:Na+ symporter
MEKREHWNSRMIFIMAAIGSAIGLGNIWRFPYIAVQNGGGAFLIPFFVALLTAGIPIMIIEYGLGVRSQASAFKALGQINKKFAFVGWLAIFAAFTIVVYYCVILAWTCNYLIHSFSVQQWGATLSTSAAFLNRNILRISQGPLQLNEIQFSILIGLILMWVLIWLIIRGGLKQVGKVLLFTVPVPVILVIILVVRGLTLEGAITGVNFYLSPDWSNFFPSIKIFTDPLNPASWIWSKVWLAAYGQVFFSLSVGFGVMIAYASFMPKKTEIPNSAAITSFSNCTFSFLSGFAVFSVLGYFATVTNVDITALATGGPGLAFKVYPVALSKLPFWVSGFTLLFFVTLLLLGIDSAFSLLEAVSAAISDKFKMSRKNSTTIVALVGLLFGLPFTTGAGLYWLDIIDHFIMSYVITFVAIAECILVGWFLGAKKFNDEVNQKAEIKLGPLFSVLIKFITPGILIIIFFISLITEFMAPYSGYPVSALILLGLGTVVSLAIISIVFTKIKVSK